MVGNASTRSRRSTNVARVPFTVVQLTDPHIGAPWSDDPAAALAAAVAAVPEVLGGPPDAVVVTGDIANDGADADYAEARRRLDRLAAPIYALPGNHDDRQALRRHFEIPADGADPGSLSYAVDLGPVRLVALDTQQPGEDGGQLDHARLEWLARTLDADRTSPTLLAMHHPPIATGVPAMDGAGIPAAERHALGEILVLHRQVHVIGAGHVHRTIVGHVGGTPVVAIPSCDMQLALDFRSPAFHMVHEPPCFAVHLLVDGRIVSHVQPIG